MLERMIMERLLARENAKCPEYTIALLGPSHIENTIKVFTRSFCDREPITKHLKIGYDEFEPLAREVVSKAAEENLSLVAVDTQGEVVGCVIAEDLYDTVKLPDLTDKFEPIFALLNELSESYLNKHPKNTAIHVWIVAVAESAAGKGLSLRLSLNCVHHAMQKGFTVGYTEVTNPRSEKSLKRLPILTLVKSIAYSDYIYNEAKPFASVSGRASAYRFPLRLNLFQEVGILLHSTRK